MNDLIHTLMPRERDLGSAIGAPVSPAVSAGGFVFTSGYMSIDPMTGERSPGDIEHETRLTLEQLQAVLAEAGADFADVVKVHVFLADLDRDFAGMNAVYETFFQPPYPARRTVQAKLVYGLKVEIEAIARMAS